MTTDVTTHDTVAIARVEVMLAGLAADMASVKETVNDLSKRFGVLEATGAARDAEVIALRDRVKALEDARCRDTERRPAWWSVAIGVCGFAAAVVVALVKGGGG